jgi:hypothetical protein
MAWETQPVTDSLGGNVATRAGRRRRTVQLSINAGIIGEVSAVESPLHSTGKMLGLVGRVIDGQLQLDKVRLPFEWVDFFTVEDYL